MSEMGGREREKSGKLGSAARRRWRELKDGEGITWRAVRDVILPTLLDIADETGTAFLVYAAGRPASPGDMRPVA